MDKLKFKKDREKLSDQEIGQHMNFDKFISGYAPVKSWFPKGTQFYSLIAAVAVVLVAAVYLVFRSDKNESAVSIKPFIDPPTLSMNISSAVFEGNNQYDTTFVYKTGTLIHVPASAFVDEKGNDINGEVEIKFREFHDPIDIMLSGIPMHYDSAGMQYQLESAGMFEVMAYQQGQPLQLKPGKEISVNMVSPTNNGNDYNIYYLDTNKRQWNYISENTESNNTCVPLFERNPAYAKEFESNTVFEKLNKPVLPKKEDPNAYNFIIDVKRTEFPELTVYKGLKFEPVESKKKFHTKLALKTWDDVVIERENDSEHYIITFSSEKESHSIKVRPVVDAKNYAETMKDHERRQKQYEVSLALRKKYANEKRDSLYRIRSVLSGTALRGNLNERFNNFIDDSFTETSKDLLVYRTFSISRLGIWNSDRPCKFVSGADFNHTAQFTSLKNEALMLKSVYLVKRDINSLYPVQEQNFNRFPFASTVDIIIGIGYNDELYYIKDEDLKQIDPGKKEILFKMKEIGGVSSSVGLKQLLKI
ncbi:MAG: hypothetical protein K8R85_13335 [Bacteroidetes bacterium]|nr:hypothetical protein [Bacteroidota bacterium]